MADLELKSDEEKAEELKAWWRANGVSVITGIVIAVGGMFGFQQWQQHKKNQSEGASAVFSQLSGKGVDTTPILAQLNGDYSGTAYQYLAALTVARAHCETGNTDKCIAQLRTASKSSQESVAIIAKIRLARTLISIGKLDEAKGIIAEKMPSAYESLVTELNGDIHFAKKEYSKAREAYDRAMLSSGGQNIQGLKLKRDDLGDHLKAGA